MLVVGEVDTGLLRGYPPGDGGESLVDLVPGERVLVSTRPRSYVRSPERPVGVDCPLGAREVRGIGTALQRAAITGNEVVQGSAYATIVPSGHTARRPWSHYLARPGRIETVGEPRWDEIADALAAPERARAALDLGAVAQRATNDVQNAVRGAAGESFRAARSRLRWVARAGEDGAPLSGVHFEVHGHKLRLLRFDAGAASPAALAAACEDVALHDWLLTTLTGILDRAGSDLTGTPASAARIRSVVSHLLHLWMPGARLTASMRRFWVPLEERAGFGRQWGTSVQRIRDHLAMSTLQRLGAAAPGASA